MDEDLWGGSAVALMCSEKLKMIRDLVMASSPGASAAYIVLCSGFLYFFFNSSIVDLQYCISFRCWISSKQILNDCTVGLWVFPTSPQILGKIPYCSNQEAGF